MSATPRVTGFTVLDADTGALLAVLPLTFSVDDAVARFERAGYCVRWFWSYDPEVLP